MLLHLNKAHAESRPKENQGETRTLSQMGKAGPKAQVKACRTDVESLEIGYCTTAGLGESGREAGTKQRLTKYL